MNKPKLNNGWTPERRKKQSESIRNWRPWDYSTGAKTEEGKRRSARNAYRGGLWLADRNMQKQINATLRAQKELLNRVM